VAWGAPKGYLGSARAVREALQGSPDHVIELTTLLRIEDLSFRYIDTEKWAVDHVDLSIEAGTITVLAGQSGCGKSTLLRCINGLIPHMYPGDYRGSITLDGATVDKTSMGDLAQKVGLLFQNPENQIFMFSVERDIAFGLENLGLPREEIRERVDEVMRLLGIVPLALRAPHELSDGQKQRVALAGVIAMRPKLIILDEPTSLLDPKTASELVGLVHRLNAELGITFVIVEHRLELLTPIADRLVVMDRGRKVMEGTPSEVLTDPMALGYGIAVPPVSMLYADLKRDGLSLARFPAVPLELAEEVNLL
jgi:energy-coupling factor transporter ATP-binding protein EcfA2